jgi:hypothetical protein
MDLNTLNCSSFNLNPDANNVYYGQFDNLEYINRGVYNRNVPDQPLRPNMDARSLPTRCVLYPTVDHRLSKHKQYENYSMANTFAPVQSNAPVSGFNVVDESRLRNQYFSLQHGADQGVYVPASTSDLYKISMAKPAQEFAQPFPSLFRIDPAVTAPPPFADKIGKDVFNNCTQTQLRVMNDF